MSSSPPPTLSQHEKAVLSCLLAGLDTKRICRTLQLQPVFVRLVFKALLHKTATHDRHQLVRWGMVHSYAPYPVTYDHFTDKGASLHGRHS